jgi:folate-dependent phosphoribosylglycinamide formyltransferase PurN
MLSSDNLKDEFRSVLICHEEDLLNRIGIARWLASFSNLEGLIILRETKKRKRKRIWREIRRVGAIRFIDVLAMRVYYKLFIRQTDRDWEKSKLRELCDKYPEIAKQTKILSTHSPNSSEAECFLQELQPDIILARCKQLLSEPIYKIAKQGTWVMHPGICPEYRNAHGCFWALASRDLDRVGMTLLRIDKGIDTGPVYGFYTYPFDELTESYMVITHRVVFDNLISLQAKFQEICKGQAQPLDTSGRASREWGQPWLSRYLSWKLAARNNRNTV